MTGRIADPLNADGLRDLWPILVDQERAEGFALLLDDDAESFFSSLPPADQAAIVQHLPTARAAMWMRFLAPDDVADVLQSIEPEQRARLRAMLDEATRREVDALLAYEEDAAGGLMSPRFVRVRPDISVEVAIRYVRQQTRNNPETLYYIFALDAGQRLRGVMSLRELFAAQPDTLIADIMNKEPVSVTDSTDQEDVARLIEQYDLIAVPVLDEEGRMRGIVTVDDIVDVLREEATEDIQKLGGSEALGAPYLDVSFLMMLKKRGGWLSLLFLGEMLTATAMGYFEGEIARVVVLAMFIPLIISSGGNSGSQAATLIVRSLALEEVRLRDWLRVFWSELRTGAALGAGLGALGFLRVVVWQQLGLFDYGDHYVRIAIAVGVSLLGVVTFGTLTGGMLPFLLRRVGFDPATSSAPFVATLVDVTGLIIYFTIAALLLSGTLL
ncbi:MAG TPA: magnesium transporter [Phycisphaerae bacterium]|mgnify:CR=1 FL=1|nr:magnesium transporter [Phycisphaerae bacterium]HRW54250.1 magnesium transporter [Phycisphaerae bacterium]